MAGDSRGDFRETLYTIDKTGKRHWVYNALVPGRFLNRRRVVIACLLLFYVLMPWITIGGQQAILLDIAARKFVFFGNVFLATDTIFLVMVLGGLALSLFFFTASFGRVWCGWACPETVFLDFVFRPIERFLEGGPAERLRLDSAPWGVRKIAIKSSKYFIFTTLCWFLASTFLAYFIGREPLIAMMQQSPVLHMTPFLFTLAIMGAMLFQFGWFREQFCTVLCPYARFQSVLMDADSLTVGYDALRGEPRGKLRKNPEASAAPQGDCIDCGLCVRVCPTGIDIRNGMQLECISCAACVDACDSVMQKIGKPLGLVRYDTERRLAGGKAHFIRPRLFVYGGLLLALFIVFAYRLSTRAPIEMQLLRGARNAPFSVLADGRVTNHLHVHAVNKTPQARAVQLEVVRPQEIQMIVPVNPFPLTPEAHVEIPVFLNFSDVILDDGKAKVTVRYTDQLTGYSFEETVSVFGPDREDEQEKHEAGEHE